MSESIDLRSEPLRPDSATRVMRYVEAWERAADTYDYAAPGIVCEAVCYAADGSRWHVDCYAEEARARRKYISRLTACEGPHAERHAADMIRAFVREARAWKAQVEREPYPNAGDRVVYQRDVHGPSCTGRVTRVTHERNGNQWIQVSAYPTGRRELVALHLARVVIS